MFTRYKISVRSAAQSDRQKLANLIHFEIYVHRHLDWRPPLDWIGSEPYLIAEHDDNPVAALACPPDPPHVAWIRLFAVSSSFSIEKAWRTLWLEALEELRDRPAVRQIAAIPLHRWFQSLLTDSGFEQTHRVIMLSWEPDDREILPVEIEGVIRPMNFDDLEAVEDIDREAFSEVWQNSKISLELAFRQASVATVVERDGGLVGYQISTATPIGGHLARLAVLPDYQGRSIGYALVRDMLSQFWRRGAQSVSVNTQQDNLISLGLYEKAGFRRTGEEYPVYQYLLTAGSRV